MRCSRRSFASPATTGRSSKTRTVGRRRPPGNRPAPSLPEGRRRRRSLLRLRCRRLFQLHRRTAGSPLRVTRRRSSSPRGGRSCVWSSHTAKGSPCRMRSGSGDRSCSWLSGIRRNDFGRQPVRAARACHRAGVAVAPPLGCAGPAARGGARPCPRPRPGCAARAEKGHARSPGSAAASGSPRARGCRAGAREGSRSTRSPSHRRLSGCPLDH